MRFDRKIWNGIKSALRVTRATSHVVRHDGGILVFMFALCAVYPLLYSLIYNPEVVRDVQVVVVDNSRSPMSRKFVRSLDATQEVAVLGYAADMEEAKEAMRNKECYGIVLIPSDFSKSVEHGGQAHVSMYCDMGVMMRYKAILIGATNVSQELGAERLKYKIEMVASGMGSIVESEEVPVGNSAMGIASAVLLFILPLVVQQSILLSMGMMHGGEMERRRLHGGYDPYDAGAGALATVVGRSFFFVSVYMVIAMYVLYIVPAIFSFPHKVEIWPIFLLAVPFVVASTMMAQFFSVLIRDREATFIVVVFTSVIFVFLVGVSWPRFAMGSFWIMLGNCIPGTWMSNAYVLMQSDGAALFQIEHYIVVLWIIAAVFTCLAYLAERFVCRPRYRAFQAIEAKDPGYLMRREINFNDA